MQIGGSVKARAAYAIIKNAVEKGWLENKTLLDASSGNTAIAYAAICSKLNIPVEICLPSNASEKRKSYLNSLGAQLIYTSELEGTDGAQVVAKQLAQENPDKYYYADQYNNNANWQAHYRGTAIEIIQQTNGNITHFITGLGTSGSFVGTAKKLKEYNPDIITIALQPNSPLHFLEGWKHMPTAHVPGIYDRTHVDELIEVDSEEAIHMIKQMARTEGLLISPSSAANIVGAKKLMESLGSDHNTIVTLMPDDISKYDEVLKMINL